MKKILIFEGRETIGGGQIITKRICDILSSKYDVSVFIPGQDNGISNLLSNYGASSGCLVSGRTQRG